MIAETGDCTTPISADRSRDMVAPRDGVNNHDTEPNAKNLRPMSGPTGSSAGSPANGLGVRSGEI